MNRRSFLKKSGQVGMAMSLPLPISGFNFNSSSKLQIGIVADVHQDVIHDGYARLRFFMDDMKKRQPDFIIQMGDFALPKLQNQPFLDVWNEFEGPAYHILGNHDMRDSGFTREQTMAWWGMKERYYSFDQGDFHFIVLDGNDKNPKPWSGYDRYIGEEQKEWLKDDLKKTQKPTVVFVHQSLEAEHGIANGEEIRDILEKSKTASKQLKVIACLCGHHHTDYVKEINGIPYIQINSMSYKWVGGKYKRERFAPHVENAFPWVKSTCPYKDPLYTLLTLDAYRGELHLEGSSTSFIAPTPKEIGMPNADEMSPTITERNLTFDN
ncbi:metallophosphoesterase family protein [Flavivirga spongiicola]|uniref:Metallophosphoesterase n=1 Tax=Flavivirga spongiicola TaxID=421621 RepID=A0ABU7XTX4_9FLAO|nr:metallophosphoesterase [Flavivirga sp. MEBiC05379]MDO5979017.1 metallophosphoesterase [Flavivirga sp. MEBiC05379]